jgi:Uma2 family endonuclease
MNSNTIQPVKSSPVRDTYKFGDGPEPVLQPGTMGWSAADLDDPAVLSLWHQGRYEILNGVLTLMPAAFFRGGECAFLLASLLRSHLGKQKISSEFASEAEIQVTPTRRVRADYACVIGDDLPKFRALKFEAAGKDWRDHALILPPTLVIESVSEGHEFHDRTTKLAWYSEFGIKNYWIVDGYARSLECLMLKDGIYLTDAMGRGLDVMSPSTFPGLILPLDEIWGDVD